MDQREGFIDTHSDTGQVERLMDCIAFSKVLAGIYDMETLLKEVLERINAIIAAKNWSLLLIDPKSRELYFAVVVGVAPEAVKDIRLKPGEGVAGAVVQTGQPIIIPDVKKIPHFCSRVDSLTGFDTRSIIAQPLIDQHCPEYNQDHNADQQQDAHQPGAKTTGLVEDGHQAKHAADKCAIEAEQKGGSMPGRLLQRAEQQGAVDQ